MFRRRRGDAERRVARAERDRRAAEARALLLERMLDALAQGALLMSLDAKVLRSNAAARRMLGAGMPDPSSALPEMSLAGVVQRAAAGPVVEERDVALPERRRLRIEAARFDDAVLVLLEDVTEVHRAEQARRDLVANVSHELRTPVSALAVLAEQLADVVHDDPEAARRFARMIGDEATRLSRLVSDLLDLSRLEVDTPLAYAQVDAAAALKEAAERVRVLAEAKHIALDVEAAPAIFAAEPSQVATALANLLDNAVRYSPEGKRVRARVVETPTELSFVVEDEGAGIPSAELPRIFERFYRVDKARSRETGGTGLGLSIVKHVADRHGGRVEAESELGRGSRFTLTLPRGPART